MGTEEGGAEIWRFGTVSLMESLQFRSKFHLAISDMYGKISTAFLSNHLKALLHGGLWLVSPFVSEYLTYNRKHIPTVSAQNPVFRTGADQL